MQRHRRLEATLLAAGIAMVATTASAQPCEPYWSDEFPSADLDGAVWGMTVFDDGSGDGPAPYIGGWFTTGGDVTLNRIAKLDGNRWSPLGSGMEGSVFALTGFDDGSGDGPALIAGGHFTTAGSVRVNRTAKWDGTSWSPLGSGVEGGGVRALAAYDDGSGSGPALYVGGDFTTAGGLRVNGIAKWDGKSWSPLGSGVEGETYTGVETLAMFDDGSGGGPALYAGGYFTTAGGVRVNNIAKWDGNSWSRLSTGVDSLVRALAVFDDGSSSGPALYASGSFTTAGGVRVNHIARWDGSTWSPVGGGTDGTVLALAVFDDGFGGGPALYAGGYFATAGGVAANHVARWDGSSWSALGIGVDGGSVRTLAACDDCSDDGPVLYAGGFFDTAGEADARAFAKWDGSLWSAVDGGLDDRAAALDVYDDGSGTGPALYVGGAFTRAGGVAANCIARFDGQIWSSVGTSMDDHMGLVSALAVFDDRSGDALYAGGWFESAGGARANHIAKWDGESWSALAAGMDSTVRALAVVNDGSGGGAALYAGGSFTEADGVKTNHIAKWDGTTWSPLGAGMNGPVYSLTAFDDGSGDGPALYAGGWFEAAGGASANHIAKWDGASWSSLGDGMDGAVNALAVFDDGSGGGPALYAGGYFTTANGVRANHVARWDGSSWSDVGGGVDRVVFALAVLDDGSGWGRALYAAGRFATAGGVSANSIARWDGASWSALGSGIVYRVRALAAHNDSSSKAPALFAVGDFTTAGGMPSQYIAEWVGCAGAVVGDLNNDGIVGLDDLLILLGSWGPCPDPPDPCPADLDGDGTVGILDLLTLLANWTEG